MNNGRSNENLMEELEGRQGAIRNLNMMGGREDYKQFHRNQIRGIKRELARRWRAAAVNKRRNRTVKRAAGAWLNTLYKPGTSTSPPGMRAARAMSAYIPAVSYANSAATMRSMLRARRKRRSNASPKKK